MCVLATATQLRQGQPVQQTGHQHCQGPHQEVRPGQQVVQGVPGDEGGDNDGDGGGEPLQDVVSVLDGGRHQQTPACTVELSANIIH